MPKEDEENMHCDLWQSLVGDSRQSLFPSCAKRVSLRLSAALLTVGDDAVHGLPAPSGESRPRLHHAASPLQDATVAAPARFRQQRLAHGRDR